MKAVVRGTAVAATLVLALTGCDDGAGPASGSGKATASAPAEKRQEPTKAVEVWVDATGLYYALPTEASVGDVFVGNEPVVAQEGQALGACSEETGSPCTGVQAVGHKEMEARGGSDDTRVEFTLFTFASGKEAAVAMKGLAEKQRASGAEDGVPSTPLTVNSDADETAALKGETNAHVILRVGSVVGHVYANFTEQADLEHVTKVQIARIRAVAAGKSPDL
ncbi:hypothetical protein [Streptomyces sp. NPDC002057]|uniref:hypothetical protein n=1 Tax=Streptomyces sp. NPDC002057 TaxID=3154664 RepID=UPI003330BEE2